MKVGRTLGQNWGTQAVSARAEAALDSLLDD